MITIICGLIGAGKSTFAAENFKNFTDADLEESKDSQIKKTLELYRKGIDVAHITCFPKNESIYDCYIQSDIDFDVVEIFETNERW